MLISVERDNILSRNVWVRGYDPVTAQGKELAFAVDDSTDVDVVAAGNLRGLSVRGGHDISIPYTKADETYQYGDELTYDEATGYVTKANPGDLVVAVVTKDYSSPVENKTVYTPSDATATVSAGVTGGTFVLGRHSNAADVRLVRIVTVEPYTAA